MALREHMTALLDSGIQMEKRPSNTMKVRFQDCDPFHHLHSGNYLDYFMSAREDHLREFYSFDLDVFATEENGAWVISKYFTSFQLPARVAEEDDPITDDFDRRVGQIRRIERARRQAA